MRIAEPVPDRPATFDECYARHRDGVYRLCLRYSAGRATFAEDVTQETFLRLYQNFDKIDQEKPVAAWLYAVASRLCISRLRHDRSVMGRLLRLLRTEADPAPSAAQLFEHHEAAAGVMAAITELPPRERVVLCMKAFDGHSQKEIARMLRLSEGYVSQLLSRARNTLTAAGWKDVDDGA